LRSTYSKGFGGLIYGDFPEPEEIMFPSCSGLAILNLDYRIYNPSNWENRFN
jgi:hypothetical protein